MKVKISEVRQDFTLCKSVIASGNTMPSIPKVQVSGLSKFGGKCDAKKIENFLWMMECYVDAKQLYDDEL